MLLKEKDESGGLTEAIKELTELGKRVVETACRLIDSLLGKPFKVAGGIVADQLQAWRWRNRVRIFARAEEIIEKEKLAKKVVPPSFLLPLLEKSGDVDDPELSEMWAKLIATAASDDQARHPAFITVLEQFSPDDAQLFQAFAAGRFYYEVTNEGRPVEYFVGNSDGVETRIDEWDVNRFDLSSGNLQRLGLVHFALKQFAGEPAVGLLADVALARSGRKFPPGQHRCLVVKLSPFAASFADACRLRRKAAPNDR